MKQPGVLRNLEDFKLEPQEVNPRFISILERPFRDTKQLRSVGNVLPKVVTRHVSTLSKNELNS
jgi:hypothetical protein